MNCLLLLLRAMLLSSPCPRRSFHGRGRGRSPVAGPIRNRISRCRPLPLPERGRLRSPESSAARRQWPLRSLAPVPAGYATGLFLHRRSRSSRAARTPRARLLRTPLLLRRRVLSPGVGGPLLAGADGGVSAPIRRCPTSSAAVFTAPIFGTTRFHSRRRTYVLSTCGILITSSF